MKKQYINHNFRSDSLDRISQANEIVSEYAEQGYELTVRQLYYQFVARALIENKESEYNKLVNLINNARLAGLLDWDSIVDRTRHLNKNSHWVSPNEILHSAAESYALDTRLNQAMYVEVWVEKEALAGVLENACEALDIPYFSCRGYVSQSAMWRAAERIRYDMRETVVLYLGDHDPSGIDMTRDIQDRLDLFRTSVDVKRIALTMEQIEKYNPPPNPAKTTDKRYREYRNHYGDESWELDALDPKIIHQLITKHVNKLTHQKNRKKLIDRQENDREKLRKIADRYK